MSGGLSGESETQWNHNNCICPQQEWTSVDKICPAEDISECCIRNGDDA